MHPARKTVPSDKFVSPWHPGYRVLPALAAVLRDLFTSHSSQTGCRRSAGSGRAASDLVFSQKLDREWMFTMQLKV
jgi:hypothetical protein